MASPDPVHLSDRVIYLPGGVNTAIVHGPDGAAVVVDSGHDRDYGRRLRRLLERLGLTLVAIVNTHAHADHFGGNAYLLDRFTVPVYAPTLEASLMASPYLEPVYLYHGARPLPELTSKWLMAPPSPVHHTLAPGVLSLAGVELEVIDTSGHAHRQMSLLVGGVLLAADALFGRSVLARYPIPFGQDLGAQLTALDTVARSGARLVLPGHGEPDDDVAALAADNRTALARVSAAVERHADGRGSEEILARVCDELEIAMNDLPRFHLNLCTVAAHLGHLRETGRLAVELRGNRLLWSRS